MTQDERWMSRYNQIMAFMKENNRRPSKYHDDERKMHAWWKQCKKQMNAGKLNDKRAELFKKMLDMGEELKRVNQYM